MDWPRRTLRQLSGANPFEGDIEVSRVALFAAGRPSLPFPHPWNFREPIRMLSSYYCGVEGLTGSARHNRYLDIPGMPHVLVTRDPAVIRAVLLATGDQPGQFDRDTRPAEGIARATGENSLLYANGPEWRRQKKLAAPPFCKSSLFRPEEFHEFESTFRQTVADRLESLRIRQKSEGAKATRIRLEPEIKVVLLEMLVNNFFGAKVPYEEFRDRFVPALDGVIDHMVCDTVAHSVRALGRKVVGLSPAVKKAKADYEALTDIALAGRPKGLGLWKQFKSDAPDERLRSNIRVFLAGALEATTSFASWALAHLARAPEVQERIYHEVKDMDVYDPDNLSQAVTLNRAMEETLRLTPSLYFLPRWSTADTRIETTDGRKLLIPRGTHVILDVWHANRCEDFWGTAETGYPAEAFAPDRWERLAKDGRDKEHLHFGFGYGPRVCPGKFLGTLEVGLVVGAFIKVFKFTAPAAEPPVRAGVSTKPADGVLVELELRP